MNNNDKVKKILESEEVPENLRPENIDIILKSGRQKKVKHYRNSFRNQYIRVFAGLMACAVFSTVGIIAIIKKVPSYENNSEILLKSADTTGFSGINKNAENSLSSIKGAGNYDEVYEIFSEASKYYNIVYDTTETESYNETDVIRGNILSENCKSNEINKAVTDGKSVFRAGGGSYINVAVINDGEFPYSYSIDIIADFSEILQSEVCGMYIAENKLIVISQNIVNENDTVTTILAYNIAYNDEKPLLAYLGEYSQSGFLSDIKINDNYIYLITSETKDLYSEINPEDYEKYLPEYYVNGEKYYPEPENIYIPSDLHELNSEELNTGFTTAGALKINHDYGNINTDHNGDIFIETDIKAFAKSAEFVYCSENNLYVTVSNYTNAYTANTDIFRFSLSEGNITPESNQNIKGIPLNQSSMSEYNGFFRIVTSYDYAEKTYPLETGETVQNFVHKKYALYVLDSDMNTVGLLDDFSNIHQDITDFRFFENTAYALTYSEQSEPAFAIDLSNPENPLLNDDLKLIYGGYMQRLNENSVLSFNSLPNQNQFKISTSENNHITAELESNFYDSEIFLYSPAIEENQALLTIPEKNIIGIPYCTQKYTGDSVTFGYDFYRIKNDSINYFGTVSEYENESCYEMNRALCVGDYIYIICADKFISCRISDSISENNSINFER